MQLVDCIDLGDSMFQPPIFREHRVEVMQALMVAHPFATVVSAATGALSADHVPLILHGDVGDRGVLRGHMSVANPLFRQTDGAIEVLTIFQGPQAYVTPSWYASKQEHGKVVPTWNYVVVHARGMLRFERGTDWLLAHLGDLTAQQESHRSEPWAVSDAPREFVEKQLRGLVGLEIAIEDLQGVWKVSQNKNLPDWTGVRDGLKEVDADAMAAIVEERRRD